MLAEYPFVVSRVIGILLASAIGRRSSMARPSLLIKFNKNNNKERIYIKIFIIIHA